MIYTSENNWYKWKYNTFFDRKILDKKFEIILSKKITKFASFKEELLNCAKKTIDYYPTLTPCIFLSGGLDSELILRSYIDIKSKIKVYIVKYENNLNEYDFYFANKICKELNIKPNIINFNLKKFFENDAEKISELSEIDNPKLLPHLKFTDYAEGLSIIGMGDIRWYRTNNDYTKKGTWVNREYEFDLGFDKYNILLNRPAIFNWFKFTPELMLSFLNLKWLKNLLNDNYYGKLGVISTKILGYKEAYNNLEERTKKTGFENIENTIKEFEIFLEKKYNGLIYRDIIEKNYDTLILELLER